MGNSKPKSKNIMIDSTQVEEALISLLPDEANPYALKLARLIADVANRIIKQEDVKNYITQDPEFTRFLLSLSGREVTTKNALVSFGSDTQAGDITIKDLANRDVININIGTGTGSSGRQHFRFVNTLNIIMVLGMIIVIMLFVTSPKIMPFFLKTSLPKVEFLGQDGTDIAVSGCENGGILGQKGNIDNHIRISDIQNLDELISIEINDSEGIHRWETNCTNPVWGVKHIKTEYNINLYYEPATIATVPTTFTMTLSFKNNAPVVYELRGMSGACCKLAKDQSIIIDIDSRKGWQSTGLLIDNKIQALTIEVIEGKWTEGKVGYPYHRGEGGSYTCGEWMPADRCLELLPNKPNGMLIGEIGNFIFGVGPYYHTVSPTISGVLFLRMNDNDLSFEDNDGILTVKISVKQ